jgi:hypothetical protein
MTTENSFDMEEEFAGIDFNSERLEKRIKRTMGTLSKHPREALNN